MFMDRHQVSVTEIMPYLMEYGVTSTYRRKYMYSIGLDMIIHIIIDYTALVEHQGRATSHWHVFHYDAPPTS